MIATDTNILVYAHRSDSEWHEQAWSGMRSLVEGRATWGIPWPCIHEFMAIVTHPRIYRPAGEWRRLAALRERCREAGLAFGVGLSPFALYRRFD